jgi:hypothetical protein
LLPCCLVALLPFCLRHKVDQENPHPLAPLAPPNPTSRNCGMTMLVPTYKVLIYLFITYTFCSKLQSTYACYMSRQQTPLDRSCKRKRTEQHSLRAKRQKSSHQSAECHLSSSLSSSFWDSLSKIWLTKDALRELDRRNSTSVVQSASQLAQPSTRPVTRKFLANLRHRRRRAQSANELLHNYTSEALKHIKAFARQGGCDLSDLRGVCMMMCPRFYAGADLRFKVS